MEGGNEPSMKADDTHRCTHHYLMMRSYIDMEIYTMKNTRGVCASRWGADSPPKRLYLPFFDSKSSAYSAFASKQGHGLLEKSRCPKTGQWYFSTSEESRA